MRLTRVVVVAVVVLTLALIPAAAFAQSPTPPAAAAAEATKELDTAAVMKELAKWDFWATLLVTLVSGAVGGVVFELLMLQGSIERPHKFSKDEASETFQYAVHTYMYDLGIFARVIIGGLAAVAALLVLAPSTAFGVVSTAVVAGSAGTAIFRSLQDRMTAALAQKETADTKTTARALSDKVDEASKAFEELKAKVVKSTSSAAGVTTLSFVPGAQLDLSELTKVEQLLSQAKGIHQTIQKPPA